MNFLEFAEKGKELGLLGFLILVVVVLAWAFWQKDKQLKDERLSVQKERLDSTKDLIAMIERKTTQDAKLEGAIDGLKDVILALPRRS